MRSRLASAVGGIIWVALALAFCLCMLYFAAEDLMHYLKARFGRHE